MIQKLAWATSAMLSHDDDCLKTYNDDFSERTANNSLIEGAQALVLSAGGLPVLSEFRSIKSL